MKVRVLAQQTVYYVAVVEASSVEEALDVAVPPELFTESDSSDWRQVEAQDATSDPNPVVAVIDREGTARDAHGEVVS